MNRAELIRKLFKLPPLLCALALGACATQYQPHSFTGTAKPGWTPFTYPHPLAAAKTADKNALPITQSVLAFLANLPGKTSAKVVSGQLADTESRNWTPIQTNYGVLPGLMGFSQDCFQGVGVAGCTLGGYRQVVPTQDVINHWNAGGLVMTTENPPNPKTLGRQTDTNFTQADMTSLLSQTGTIWSNYKAFLDASATLYATLQAAGVVVIIHMLHEMNAGWFWYGAAEITPAQYISLWQMQFNYYTVTKGLHNLLFTYGPDPTSGNLTAYYPGDNFIDIVSTHNYYSGSSTPVTDMGGAYAALTSAFPSKPFAFTEVGLFPGNQTCPIPAPANFANLIAGIKANMPKVTFFMFWKDIWTMGNACDVTTPNASVGTLLSDPWIINKGGVRLRALNPGVPFRSVGPP